MTLSYRFKPITPVTTYSDNKIKDPNYNYWKSLGEPSIVSQQGAVWNISFQRNDPFHYAVSSSTRVKIYDSTSGDEVRSFRRFHDLVYSAKFRRDGRLLVAGNEDKQIRLFESDGRVPLRIFKGHTGPVRLTDFCEDDKRIYSGSDDFSVRVWDVSTEQVVNHFNEHMDYIRCGTTIQNVENCIITGSYDHTVRMFDLRSDKCTMTLDHGDVVDSVLAFPSKSIVLSAGGTCVKVWDMLHGGRLIASLSNHHKAVTCMCLNHDFTRLLSGSMDGHVKVYDVGSYKVVHDIKYPAPILSMGLSPDEDKQLVVGMSNNTVSVRQRKSAVKPDHVEQFTSLKKERKKREALYMRGEQFTAHADDIVIKNTQKQELQKYDHFLRKFEHSRALDQALSAFVHNKSPEVTVAVLEELIRREVLSSSLIGKTEKKLIELIKFLSKNMTKPYFEKTLLQVAETLIDVYAPQWLELSDTVRRHFVQLRYVVRREALVKTEITKLAGCLHLIVTNNHIMTSSK